MTDTYQNWIDRVVGGGDAKPLSSGEVVKSSSGEPFGTIEFVKVKKNNFLAEVGKKGDKYIYHFFPSPMYLPPDNDGSKFYQALTDTFLEVFKREDQVEAGWTAEMKSWAVRVSGWANHVWGDELALRAIDKLDELLAGGTS